MSYRAQPNMRKVIAFIYTLTWKSFLTSNSEPLLSRTNTDEGKL